MQNSTKEKPLVIGSRGSQLALWQANHVAGILGNGTEIKVIKTSGDKFLDQNLQGQADKGFFTKEIEDELLAGTVDLAVHSLKDLPTILPEGLTLGIVSKRAAVSDLLLVRPDMVDESRVIPVKSESRIGATSLRRQSLLRRFAQDLRPTFLRGNVPTRVEKLRRGEYEAITIARAGIDRLELDLSDLLVFELNPEVWLPAPGQAALGVEIRENDSRVREAIAVINDDNTKRTVKIERDLLTKFEGGCHTAFGALARPVGDAMEVLVGFEDEQGRWFAAKELADNDEQLKNLAYEKLMRVIENKREEDEFCSTIAKKIKLSY